MSSTNFHLNNAARVRNDEFYTRIEDIEKELQHYKNHLENKIVYCNCDNPQTSEFYKYFHDNFYSLKLKKIITTHFDASEQAYIYEFNGISYIKTYLLSNGDLRSDECIQIIKDADIVITNPPSSIFEEYMRILFKYDKKYLIIGSNLAIGKEIIFNKFQNGEMWLGVNSGSIKFKTPSNDLRSVNSLWYTNLEHNQFIGNLSLSKIYNNNYPTYDNHKFSNVINVDEVKNIPSNYSGIIGVPLSFIIKYNPEQFELVHVLNNPFVRRRKIFRRILIRKKQ